MSKVDVPLLSFEAAGNIGGVIQFQPYRGVTLAKRFVPATDQNSTAQQQVRGAFGFCSLAWKFMPTAMRANYTLAAKGTRQQPRNRFIGHSVPQLSGQSDLTLWQVIHESAGMIELPSATFGISFNLIYADFSATNWPPGFTLHKRCACAIRQQDPYNPTDPTFHYAEDQNPSGHLEVTGLQSGVQYLCEAWAQATNRAGVTGIFTPRQTLRTPL